MQPGRMDLKKILHCNGRGTSLADLPSQAGSAAKRFLANLVQ